MKNKEIIEKLLSQCRDEAEKRMVEHTIYTIEEEFKKKIEKLIKEIINWNYKDEENSEMLFKSDVFFLIDEIFEELKGIKFTTIKEIKSVGNSGAVIIPKDFVGDFARVMVLEKPKTSFTEMRIYKKNKEAKVKKKS